MHATTPAARNLICRVRSALELEAFVRRPATSTAFPVSRAFSAAQGALQSTVGVAVRANATRSIGGS